MDMHADWWRGFHSRHSAAHGMPLPCCWGGGACKCTALSRESVCFYGLKDLSARAVRVLYVLLLFFWPWVLLLWLFIGPWLCFRARKTPAESWLPTDWTYSWKQGWMGGPPVKPTGEHTGHRKVWGERAVVMCRRLMSYWANGHSYDVYVRACVFLCALTSYRLMSWIYAAGDVWISRKAGRQIPLRQQTADQSVPPLQYIHVSMR